MRFQKGVGYPYPQFRPPRGPGRGDPRYDMTRKAHLARLHAAGRRKVVGGKPLRTWGETRRLELEIALGTHRGESCRAMAKRLDCSHVHCWRVARDYRRGLIPMLPPDEQTLLAMRDSLDAPMSPPRPCVEPPLGRDAPPHVAPPEPPRHFYEDVGRSMTADERIDEECAARAREAHEEQRRHPHLQGSGRRTFCTVPPWLRPKP